MFKKTAGFIEKYLVQLVLCLKLEMLSKECMGKFIAVLVELSLKLSLVFKNILHNIAYRR